MQKVPLIQKTQNKNNDHYLLFLGELTRYSTVYEALFGVADHSEDAAQFLPPLRPWLRIWHFLAIGKCKVF